MVEQLADDETTLLEAHKWVLSILQVAAEVNLWADKARPRFTEIVGPYKKWGGDNSDAFYYYAPIDPTRTYRVRLDPGDAVYMSLTVYGGPDDGRYSTRIVGSANSQETERDEDGAIHMVISPNDPAEPGVAWIRLEADAVAAITRDYLQDPRVGRRAAWRIEADDPPETYRQDDADLARRIRAATDVGPGAGQHRAHPARHAQRHRPALPGAHHHLRLGGRRRRLRAWAHSSWPTTRPSSSAGVPPSASSGTCACGTGCSTPTTTTTSG